MKFSIKDLFSKCDKIRSFLRNWTHLLKKSLMTYFTFCAIIVALCCAIFNVNKNLVISANKFKIEVFNATVCKL